MLDGARDFGDGTFRPQTCSTLREQRARMPAKQQLPWWVVTPLIALWCVMMLFVIYQGLEAWRARVEIRAFLDSADGDFILSVNGHSAQNSAAVLKAIRDIHTKAAHHSHPEHEIAIVVQRKQGVLELTLGRDSDLQDEHWVFWTRQVKKTNRLELGRIESSVFDKE